jgi:hemolysin activation/secretion protein
VGFVIVYKVPASFMYMPIQRIVLIQSDKDPHSVRNPTPQKKQLPVALAFGLFAISIPLAPMALSADSTVGGINATNNPGSISPTGLEQVQGTGRLERLEKFKLVDEGTVKPGDEVITIQLSDSHSKKAIAVPNGLKGIQITGSTRYSQSDFQPYVDQFLASPRTEADVHTLVAGIDKLYHKAGYLSVKTLYTGVENGALKLRVVEGHISEIRVEGNRFQPDKRIKKAFDIEENSLLNLPELEKKIVETNESQDLYQVKARLKGGNTPGDSILTYEVKERLPYQLSVFSDNRGRPLIGQVRWGGNFTYESPLGLGDEFNIGYVGARGTDIAETSYQLPVNDKGTSVGVAYSFGHVDVQNRTGPDELTGKANNFSVFANQDIEQVPGLSASAGLNVRKIRAYLNDNKSGESDVTSTTLGLNWEKADRYGHTNLNTIMTGSQSGV